MNQAVLALGIIRAFEALRRNYSGRITGRRAQRFFIQVRQRVLEPGPERNRKARRANGELSDFRDVVAALSWRA
jgi:hypothetical protein